MRIHNGARDHEKTTGASEFFDSDIAGIVVKYCNSNQTNYVSVKLVFGVIVFPFSLLMSCHEPSDE